MGSGEWGNVELRDLDLIIPIQPETILINLYRWREKDEGLLRAID